MTFLTRYPECVTWLSTGVQNWCTYTMWVSHWTALPV